MHLIRFIALLVLPFTLALMACSPTDKQEGIKPSTVVKSVPFSLTLRQIDDASFELSVDLNEPQSVLFFSRSQQDYRLNTYESLNSEAKLVRVGGFDTIVFQPGATQALFRVTAYTGPMPGTYTAFVPFTDGGQAVYLGAFELLRAESTEAIEQLGGDLDSWDGDQFDIPVRLETTGRIMLNGVVTDNSTELTIKGSGPYAYLGSGALVEGESFSGILDPGLPKWLANSFDSELGLIFKALEQSFGRTLDDKASIFLAFRGFEPEGVSNTGGAMSGGQLMLEMSGSMFREPNDRLKGYIQWFLTHEAAHLFQQAGNDIPYSERSDSWLLEGSANAITHILLSDLGTVPDDVIQRQYELAYEFCIESIKGASMAEITERHDQSHYDCGDFLWRVADAALPNQTVFDLWKGMTERAVAKDGEDIVSYNTESFFEELTRRGIADEIIVDMRGFVSGPNPNPSETLRALMQQTGITATFSEDKLTKITFPE